MRAEYLFFAVFAAIAGSMLYGVARHRGVRGALFGARVQQTVAEFELQRRGFGKCRLKVHTLEGAEGQESAPRVGLELVYSSVGSWQMIPISLTVEEARGVAQALQRAIEQAGAQLDTLGRRR